VPTYQYTCTDCDEPLEAVQSFTDDALTECPRCDGRLRKVFSAVGVVFKGSGFYRNDSRPKGKDGSNGAGSGDGAKEQAAASTKTDSAPSGSSSSGESAGSSGGEGSKKASSTAPAKTPAKTGSSSTGSSSTS